jgi:SAM-dependent methyltransferase
MRGRLASGSILEIGSGIGMARAYFPGLVTSDVAPTKFVDLAVSAYAVPEQQWNNIIAIDMLHHLQEPLRFLASAAKALAPGGRIVLAEPAGTRWGRLFYRWFHHEPCLPEDVRPPFTFKADASGGFANMGIGHVLFGRERELVMAGLRQHQLSLVDVHYRDFLAYPATGGFSRSALLPASILSALLAIERMLPQFLMRRLGLRMIVVLEKRQHA